MTKKSTKKKSPRSTKKNLTVSEYLLFTETISRIRSLERVATECFMKGNVDRSQLAKALGKELDRIHIKILPGFGKCRYPYCGSGVCEWCAATAARQQLAKMLAELSSNRT